MSTLIGKYVILSVAHHNQHAHALAEMIDVFETPELVFMSGDYILYVSSISGLVNNGLTKPQDFQELVDALFRKLLSFAKKEAG